MAGLSGSCLRRLRCCTYRNMPMQATISLYSLGWREYLVYSSDRQMLYHHRCLRTLRCAKNQLESLIYAPRPLLMSQLCLTSPVECGRCRALTNSLNVIPLASDPTCPLLSVLTHQTRSVLKRLNSSLPRDRNFGRPSGFYIAPIRLWELLVAPCKD